MPAAGGMTQTTRRRIVVAKPSSIDELKSIALKAISQKAGIKRALPC
jgi:hypothetical protein